VRAHPDPPATDQGRGARAASKHAMTIAQGQPQVSRPSAPGHEQPAGGRIPRWTPGGHLVSAVRHPHVRGSCAILGSRSGPRRTETVLQGHETAESDSPLWLLRGLQRGVSVQRMGGEVHPPVAHAGRSPRARVFARDSDWCVLPPTPQAPRGEVSCKRRAYPSAGWRASRPPLRWL
jgi:hypothetical protein